MTTAEQQTDSRPEADTLFIDGRWKCAEQTYERFDPARLDRLTGRFASATEQHVRQAYAAALAAQPGWAATPAPRRADVLRLAADELEAGAERAARRLTAEGFEQHEPRAGQGRAPVLHDHQDRLSALRVGASGCPRIPRLAARSLRRRAGVRSPRLLRGSGGLVG